MTHPSTLSRFVPFAGLALGALSAAPAAAATALDSVSTSLRFDAEETRASVLAQDADASTQQSPAPPVSQVPQYGRPGAWWIGIGGGIAPGQTDGEFSLDGRLTLTTSTFLVEDFEFLMEWSLWGYSQEGPDTVGASWSFLFRLHFPFDDDKRTTFFLDGGVGIMASAEEVPDHGTNINFLPTLGAGLSHQLGDGPARLVGGVRWHHISNARFKGEDNNPSRDGAMVYLAYTFPF